MSDDASADSSNSQWFKVFRGGDPPEVVSRKKYIDTRRSWDLSWKKLLVVGGSIVTAYFVYKWVWASDSESDRNLKRRRNSTAESLRYNNNRRPRTFSSPRVSDDKVLELLAHSEASEEEDEEEVKEMVYDADPHYIPNPVSTDKLAVGGNDAQFSSIFNHLCSTTTTSVSAQSQPGSETVVVENQDSKSVTPDAGDMENQNEPPNDYGVRTVANGKTSLENLKERFVNGNLPSALQVKNIDNKNYPGATGVAVGGPLKEL